ncbi:MAG: hypothetical protein HWN65_19095 [Candidatus Helarchaeota archaeon]|nr:hypothetical protein [Candidatus Helarchaeota archaeon]
MTHSLHRKGTKEDLKSDYVILAMRAAGIHDTTPEVKERARQKLLRIGEIMGQHKPTNIMMDRLQRFSPAITASFDNIKPVKQVLQVLKQEVLGISIVVSGLISEIQKAVKDVGLQMHTVHLSLGVFGKKELLPSEKILELTTMCGHHCVSPQSVTHYVEQIKKNKINIDAAAQELAKPCVCGIVNPTRVRQILSELLA